MRRLILLAAVALFVAGCGDDARWDGKGCSTNGDVTVCQIKKADGTTCEAVKDGGYSSTNCTNDSEMDCVEEGTDANTSGNICRVPMGDGTYCVAVLPDGGKAPKDYKDFVTCPKSNNDKEAED